ncbi:MAG: hypothetical protein KDD45_09735 [Bdellovibrionales bacterium]|nr:hypothetical protein [Bdellovibrionales bacterium]
MNKKFYSKVLMVIIAALTFSQGSFAASGEIIGSLVKAYRAAERMGQSTIIAGFNLIEGDIRGMMGVYKSLGRETTLLGRSYKLGFEQEVYRQGAGEFKDVITVVPITQFSNIAYNSSAKKGTEILAGIVENVAKKTGVRYLGSDAKRLAVTLDFENYSQFELFLTQYNEAVQQAIARGIIY